MSPELSERLATLRLRIETELGRALRLTDDCPEQLATSMRYSLLAGGKRLRPILVLLSCEACGGDWETALPAACAIEMIHTYSLIHDDLPAMDDDDLRRGQPTNHIRFGEATAILAGDGLLTRAFEVLVSGLADPQIAAACCLDLASAAGPEGMVGGQQADLEAETSGVADVAQLEAIHRRKTGRLLCSALTMGGRIAGASSQLLQKLQSYGMSVGLAFQIADDLLDVMGEQEKLGKGVRKDSEIGKLTYPGLLGIAESQRRAADLVQRACAELAELGTRGEPLRELARYAVQRDR
jgi:geranylgeranyl diphosphate synthase type II